MYDEIPKAVIEKNPEGYRYYNKRKPDAHPRQSGEIFQRPV